MPGQQTILAVEPRSWTRVLLLTWTAFWLIGLILTFPVSNAPDMFRFRLSLALSESAAALLLWVFCRWLWKSNWSWTWRIAIAGTISFVLGYISAVGSQWAVPWGNPEEHHFYASLVLGTYESALTSFPLVACAGIYFAAWQWQEARERETRILRAETLAREAELRALRAELTPHFLFNTLNGISTLVGEGQTQEACRMIARLSDFLRATLENTGNNQVSLEQEIHYVQDYLAIEQERLGNRLRQRVILDPSAADARVPTLLLQPLIENAIQHGIAPNPSGGELTVHARKHGARLRISIVNTRDAQFAAARAGSGLGIKNSRERLITAYADAADFAVLESESRWEISIELPFSQMERFDAGVARDVA